MVFSPFRLMEGRIIGVEWISPGLAEPQVERRNSVDGYDNLCASLTSTPQIFDDEQFCIRQ